MLAVEDAEGVAGDRLRGQTRGKALSNVLHQAGIVLQIVLADSHWIASMPDRHQHVDRRGGLLAGFDLGRAEAQAERLDQGRSVRFFGGLHGPGAPGRIFEP